MSDRNPFALYVHVPFCKKKCLYCDFYSVACCDESTKQYLTDLMVEIRNKAMLHSQVAAKSLYIGGGTPSVLPPMHLAMIINAISTSFSLEDDAEITVEANPGTISEQLVSILVKAGTTRISLGVQAKQQQILKAIGRIHSKDEVESSIKLLQENGIDNINADLMCGLPGQSVKDVLDSVAWVINQGVTHVSLYPLHLEDTTPMAKAVRQGTIELPDDELTIRMIEESTKLLHKSGFARYEIANFARPGYQSKHNLVYWRNESYLGFGPAAASYFQGTRHVNSPSLVDYHHDIQEVGLPRAVIDKESTFSEVAMAETVFMGLRLLLEGLQKKRFLQRFKVSLREAYGDVIDELVQQGLLTESSDAIVLTPKAVPIANQVFMKFLID